jgi:hypothetical protein
MTVRRERARPGVNSSKRKERRPKFPKVTIRQCPDCGKNYEIGVGRPEHMCEKSN